jgi:hypothetical protein
LVWLETLQPAFYDCNFLQIDKTPISEHNLALVLGALTFFRRPAR